MTREEIIHIFENSRLVSEHFYSEAVTAAYIEGLAALREQEERRWIPVTERLPDVGIEVLIYSEDDGVCVDYYGGDSFGYYDVTHWMPLPESPKEDA